MKIAISLILMVLFHVMLSTSIFESAVVAILIVIIVLIISLADYVVDSYRILRNIVIVTMGIDNDDKET